MVELVEVEDESFEGKQAGPEDDEYYTDTDSSISDDDNDDAGGADLADSETLAERLYALRDMVPPTTRSAIASALSTTQAYLTGGLVLGGKFMWVGCTGMLMIGVPWALAFAEEQQVMDMEKEMKMREAGSEMFQQQQPGTGAAQASL